MNSFNPYYRRQIIHKKLLKIFDDRDQKSDKYKRLFQISTYKGWLYSLSLQDRL
jgi:hypothetical protein